MHLKAWCFIVLSGAEGFWEPRVTKHQAVCFGSRSNLPLPSVNPRSFSVISVMAAQHWMERKHLCDYVMNIWNDVYDTLRVFIFHGFQTDCVLDCGSVYVSSSPPRSVQSAPTGSKNPLESKQIHCAFNCSDYVKLMKAYLFPPPLVYCTHRRHGDSIYW